MLSRFTWLLAMVLWLSGCAMQPAPAPALSALPVAPTQSLQLHFLHDGEQHSMMGVLRRNNDSLRLVLLSPQGQRVLTWWRDAQGAQMTSALGQPPFDADWLGSRLAWSLWPAQSLQEAFAQSRWSLRGSEDVRAIYYRDQLVAKVKIAGHCRSIDDLEAGYQLTISVADTARKLSPCPSS